MGYIGCNGSWLENDEKIKMVKLCIHDKVHRNKGYVSDIQDRINLVHLNDLNHMNHLLPYFWNLGSFIFSELCKNILIFLLFIERARFKARRKFDFWNERARKN